MFLPVTIGRLSDYVLSLNKHNFTVIAHIHMVSYQALLGKNPPLEISRTQSEKNCQKGKKIDKFLSIFGHWVCW